MEKAGPEGRFQKEGHSRRWSGQQWAVSKEFRGGALALERPLGISTRAASAGGAGDGNPGKGVSKSPKEDRTEVC